MAKMTIDEIIHDLEALDDYFKEEYKDKVPVCLEESIEILKALKKLKEV